MVPDEMLLGQRLVGGLEAPLNTQLRKSNLESNDSRPNGRLRKRSRRRGKGKAVILITLLHLMSVLMASKFVSATYSSTSFASSTPQSSLLAGISYNEDENRLEKEAQLAQVAELMNQRFDPMALHTSLTANLEPTEDASLVPPMSRDESPKLGADLALSGSTEVERFATSGRPSSTLGESISTTPISTASNSNLALKENIVNNITSNSANVPKQGSTATVPWPQAARSQLDSRNVIRGSSANDEEEEKEPTTTMPATTTTISNDQYSQATPGAWRPLQVGQPASNKSAGDAGLLIANTNLSVSTMNNNSSIEPGNYSMGLQSTGQQASDANGTNIKIGLISNTTQTDSSNVYQSSAPAVQSDSVDFGVDLLHDTSSHETDKLSHQVNPMRQTEQSSRSRTNDLNSKFLQSQSNGWQPSSDRHQQQYPELKSIVNEPRLRPAPSPPHKQVTSPLRSPNSVQLAPEQASFATQTQTFMSPKPTLVREVDPPNDLTSLNGYEEEEHQGQQQQQQQEHETLSNELPDYDIAHDSYQSSLKPKHVPPPSDLQPEMGVSLTDPPKQVANQWQSEPMPPSAGHMTTTAIRPMASAVNSPSRPRYVIRPPAKHWQTPDKAQANQQQQQQRPPFVSALRAKSFGLLPRLAAKLFSGTGQQQQQSPLEQDLLNQQQSHLLATHHSPPVLPIQVPIPSFHGKVVPKLFPKSVLVKNLFAREPGTLGRPSILSGSRRPKSAAIDGQQPRPAPLQTRLVLMNGQLYSVLTSPSAMQTDLPEKGAFDHQTSDTSEFPVFEAMSLQHMMAPMAPPSPQAQPLQPPPIRQTTNPVNHLESSSSSSRPTTSLRCDRPRHVIQADRTVVNHILQSQQNFVIARVPIRKYVRPEVAQAPSQLYQAIPMPMQMPMQVPMHMMAAMSAPNPAEPAPIAANQAPAFAFATNRVPVFQPPSSIEVSASMQRGGLLQSIANLVSSLRYGSRRPLVGDMIQPSSLVAGSSPTAVFVGGPLMMAAGRRQSKPFNWPRRSKLNRRRPFSWRELAFGNQLSGSSGYYPIQSYANDQAPFGSMLNGQYSDPLMSQSQVEQTVDPMRRLLMLKTSNDNEVCSPVSQTGSKIKYSCVPNYCVVQALANSTAAAAASQLGSSAPQVAPNPPPVQGYSMNQFGQHVNSNMAYKSSYSMQDFSQQQPSYPSQQQLPTGAELSNQYGQINGLADRQKAWRPRNETEEHVQVQQFDDLPNQVGGPLVTYTHINAYNPPAFSKLVQPQHQQYVSSTQTLDALANNEAQLSNENETPQFVTGEPEYQTPQQQQIPAQALYGAINQREPMVPTRAAVLYQPQASDLPMQQLSHNSQAIGAMQVIDQPQVMGQVTDPLRMINYNRMTSTQRPSLTFSSAYIVGAPVATQGAYGSASAGKLAPPTYQKKEPINNNASQGDRNRDQDIEDGQPDKYGPTAGNELEPNEFVSAVDEKLERPIQVHRSRQSTRNEPRNSMQSAPIDRQVGGGGSSSAQFIERAPSPAPKRHQVNQYAQSALEQRRRASNGDKGQWRPNAIRPPRANRWAQNNRRLSPSNKEHQKIRVLNRPVKNDATEEGPDNDDAGDDDETVTDYEQSDDFGPPTGVEQPQQAEPANRETAKPEPVNVRQPIPVIKRPAINQKSARQRQQQQQQQQLHQPEAAMAREIKTRRDNKAGSAAHTTSAPTLLANAIRYGLRSTTPLPAPEKSDLSDDSPREPLDEDQYPPGNGTGTTECDCSKPPDRNGNSDETSTTAGPQFGALNSHYEHLRRPNQVVSTSLKRNPTTLRPIKPQRTVGQLNQRNDLTAERIGRPELAPTEQLVDAALQLAKDRRQTQPAPVGFSNPVRYTTKRPYNLRNTTYKNLMLSNNSHNNAVSVPLSSAGSAEQPSHFRDTDISTTTAATAADRGQQQQPHQVVATATPTRLADIGNYSLSHPANGQQQQQVEFNSNNSQTQFDDSSTSAGITSSEQPPPASHSVNYGELEVTSHLGAQVGSRLPRPIEQVNASAPNSDVKSEDTERYLELGNEVSDKLLGGRTDQEHGVAAKQTWQRAMAAQRLHGTQLNRLPAGVSLGQLPVPGKRDAQTGSGSVPKENENNNNSATNAVSRAEQASQSFKPSSVNDIVAEARRESWPSKEADNSQRTEAGALVAAKEPLKQWHEVKNSGSPEEERQHESESAALSERAPMANKGNGSEREREQEQDQENEHEEAEGDKDVTPHQYQIQVRWSNSSHQAAADSPAEAISYPAGGASSETMASSVLPHRKAKSHEAEQELAMDKMKERVRDRLFEHREEEHWHDKSWLKLAKKRKLIAGKWVIVPVQPLLPGHHQLDYGPHAHERETPIKDQLSNWPSKEEMEQHFAIPTANFRQSAKFVDWAQSDVNMDEEPGEPNSNSNSNSNVKSKIRRPTE